MTSCRFRRAHALVPAASWALAILISPALCAGETLGRADSLRLTGRYVEARAAYSALAKQAPLAAALGVARCDGAVGKLDEALRALRAAAERHPRDAAPHSEMARLEFERGDHSAARRHADAALELDPHHCAARWIGAEIHRVAGRLDEADEAYRWLVRFYNSRQDSIRDPEVLRWIGLAAAQNARWNRASGQFHFLVNTLYPEALALEPLYWPAHLEAALLFIEKYNRPEAEKDLASALAINPDAAELHAARGLIAFQRLDLDSAWAAIDRALELNPRLAAALRVRADVEMVTAGPRAAVASLEAARALNPADEETLGRLAAVYGAIDGLRENPAGTRMGAVIEEAAGRNPRCGSFFAALASALDLLRKYPHAARYYEEARRRMPRLVAVPGQLGLVYMRLGDEEQAARLLEDAFDADPFNVRVKNSLEVLEVLKGYEAIETEHFVVKFDPAKDSLLAHYASRYLEEEVYPEIVAALGYEPPGRSLFEIFNRAKGTSGHGWFSARMVGLPFIGTVGACAGKMVALASPGDMPHGYNWARVLKHEFVHVVNLQQTDFNIPHWYTEALAVRHEGPGRPAGWDEILARRAASGRLFDLGSINMGFVRPASGDDWSLAYYQAELYARYMADTYGEGAQAKMLAAYADNLDTRSALKRAFRVSQEAFEKGYRKYVEGIAGPPPAEMPPLRDASTLLSEADRNPGDPAVLAELAYSFLVTGLAFRARHYAEAALAIDPKHRFAGYVLARAHASERREEEALEVLRRAFDPAEPFEPALTLLASLTLERKDYAEAERLCSIGLARFPRSHSWLALLVKLYRETGQQEKLVQALERMAERNSDDLSVRKELARLALAREDYEAAARWARQAMFVKVEDPEAHAMLARASNRSGRRERAIEEYEAAIRLQPGEPAWRLELAETLIAEGRKDRARQVLAELLEQNEDHPKARELLESLGR